MTIAIVGAGPAGLMAAEVLAQAGQSVAVFDAMPSVGRKFLLAGIGGLNLTHSEATPAFLSRYDAASQAALAPMLHAFGADALRQWAADLGVPTFVGSSGRVFPVGMKAAPLLRAWLHRLRHPQAAASSADPAKTAGQAPAWAAAGEATALAPATQVGQLHQTWAAQQTGQAAQADLAARPAAGVVFHMRHRWLGWDEAGQLLFDSPHGQVQVRARATVLALGGGSWARLGSDGAWVPWLQARGVAVAPLLPANCGFEAQGGWSAILQKQAGQPLKNVALRCAHGTLAFARKGECVLTQHGLEGSLVYAASALIRDAIAQTGSATVYLDLLPDVSAQAVLAAVRHPRGARSWSSHLKSRLGLSGVKAALLQEVMHRQGLGQPADHVALQAWGEAIKQLPLCLDKARPLDEAISSAGGVCWSALLPGQAGGRTAWREVGGEGGLMLRALPGVFCAGEMLDWEAPTGGYLLTACMASGRWAGQGALNWLAHQGP